ncbi:zwei Ig domain protein zig-8-like isoform X1 [Limulus polyphemus]|uniref:Zwei Ig domain protein zig-8-like isoform X1 n=1 Tax=Limulus polyphemus TaxID=6850 RepID=A0ABM1S4N3_LIMPO|nr:zwei Ig domain protein zig-8-like isoform X1 [Limulus polyphemus]
MLEAQEYSHLQTKKLSLLAIRRLLRLILRIAIFSTLLLLGTTRTQNNDTSTNTSMPDKRSLTEEDNGGEYWVAETYNFPAFDNNTAKNVSTQLGQTAFLHCIVENLGDKTVSWIRRKDFHVLTVGTDKYISDDRFQTVRTGNDNDWVLQIKFTQLKDQGIYECQVSTDPKISVFVNLSVLVAEATISGGPKIIVEKGSSIELTCVISNSSDPPKFVFWYHNNRMINYDSTRGDISVEKAAAKTVISKLYIRDIGEAESGNYTCGPSNAGPTSVSVVISNGENPAAMQHDGNSAPLNGVQTRASLLWNLLLSLSLINYVTR